MSEAREVKQLDLDRLREVAEAATPGPWDASSVAETVKLGYLAERDRDFIATFDPPTVLALIEGMDEAKGLLLSLTGGGMDPMERAKRLRAWFDRVRRFC